MYRLYHYVIHNYLSSDIHNYAMPGGCWWQRPKELGDPRRLRRRAGAAMSFGRFPEMMGSEMATTGIILVCCMVCCMVCYMVCYMIVNDSK